MGRNTRYRSILGEDSVRLLVTRKYLFKTENRKTENIDMAKDMTVLYLKEKTGNRRNDTGIRNYYKIYKVGLTPIYNAIYERQPL